MPQLNPEFFLSQIFWLVLTFSFLLLFLWKISLPRIKDVLKKREDKISNDLDMAKSIQLQAENLQKKIDSDIVEAEKQAQELVKNGISNFRNEAEEKIKSLDSELEKRISDTSASIIKTKDESLINLKNEVTELTSVTINKLTKIEIEENYIKNEVNKIDFNLKDLS